MAATGKTLEVLAGELKAKQARKRDLVLDSADIRVLTSEGGTEIVVPESVNGGLVHLKPEHLMFRNLGQHVGVRADLMDRLSAVYPQQFDSLVNGILGNMHSAENDGNRVRRMLRTYTPNGDDGGVGIARCLLSDKYRTIDNLDVAEAALPAIAKIPGVEIRECELTETKMYMKVVHPGVSCNLRDLLKPGTHNIYDNDDPDTLYAGFVLSNSEVGAGALSVENMLFRVRCSNGMIVGKSLRRTHVGKTAEVNEDYSVYSDETRKADDRVLMMKVHDAVTAAVGQTKFTALAQQFADTQDTAPLEKPKVAMEVLGEKLGLTEDEGESVLTHLIQGGDLSQFGAINAVTRAAQDVESYDRRIEVEALGATVMAMPRPEWETLATAA